MASHTPSTPVPGPVRSLGPALRDPSGSQVTPSCRKGAGYVSLALDSGPHSCCPSRCPRSTVAGPRARKTAFSLPVLAPGPHSAAAPGPCRRRAAILPAAEANTVVAPESPPVPSASSSAGSAPPSSQQPPTRHPLPLLTAHAGVWSPLTPTAPSPSFHTTPMVLEGPSAPVCNSLATEAPRSSEGS